MVSRMYLECVFGNGLLMRVLGYEYLKIEAKKDL